MTIFSNHLFDGYTIVDWAYQKTPNSTIWAVRSDGVVLSLTYVKDQQMLAWTRHDFGGFAENVCAVPNGTIYDVYFVIRRLVPYFGAASFGNIYSRYVERLSDREILLQDQYNVAAQDEDDFYATTIGTIRYRSNAPEINFSDSCYSYDGRNSDITQIGSIEEYLSGGFSAGALLKISLSSGLFNTDCVGDTVHFKDSDGNLYIFEIEQYVGTSTVRARSTRDVPKELQGVAVTSDWAVGKKTFYGLWHLEGKQVSIRGDGLVVANPNNSQYAVVTVTNGTITLNKCYSIIHIGLPYTSDIGTLAIDGTQNTTVGKQQLIKKVYIHTEKTQTMWVGTRNPDNIKLNAGQDPLYGLNEIKNRDEENYDQAAGMLKERFEVKVESTYEEQAEVFIRNVDPTPLSVLAITPEGVLNFS